MIGMTHAADDELASLQDETGTPDAPVLGSKHLCPRMPFNFAGRCPVDTCMLWYKAESADNTCCLQLDHGVMNGEQMLESTNAPLLARLAKSDDPQKQLAVSKSLLHFAMFFGTHMAEYVSEPNSSHCRCGANKKHCPGSGEACNSRRGATDWLLNLMSPLSRSEVIPLREMRHFVVASLFMYAKTYTLPPAIRELLRECGIDRRTYS